MGFLSKIFKSADDKAVAKMASLADEVIAKENLYSAMSDDELRDCTVKFKERIAEGEKVNELLVDAFAVVREAAFRVLNMKHFKVQIIGGIALHRGKIAEMATGEGKTLASTLPAYLNALVGKGVHIVTVNEYLAKRDAEWMGKIYKFLGMTVGVVYPQMEHKDKQAAYNCDITYTTNNELGFDYLRDNMIAHKEQKLQRDLYYAIVDEVDSILIDEARTPLIISGGSGKSSEMYSIANRFSKTLKDEDIIIEEKEKTVRLSEEGVEKAERFFKIDNLSDIENQETQHYINNSIRAKFIMQRDIDYVVNDGEIMIVDEFTGRMMVGRRYSNGLHQAIEAKENVKIQSESKTLATITFQNFFRLYKKISGMTGTAKTEESEFNGIYKLEVMKIPTNMPLARKDENDKLYTTKKGKYNAILEDIKKSYERNQPILIGTATVEKSEELSRLLTGAKLPHNVLNAKNHAHEAEIIAQAGKIGAITIATNMAGRGTDIVLGGNPEFLAKQKLANLGYSHEAITEATSFAVLDNEEFINARAEYNKYYELFKQDTSDERAKVVELGGLRIVGSERHDSRRIDDQLRGRAGRQGDPGSSVFYLSMEDDLVRIFGGETMKSIAEKFKLEEDMPINLSIITNQIEKAQMRIENRDFSIRKQVLNYDDVMNYQRKIIYAERNKVIEGIDIHDQIERMIIDVTENILNESINTYDSVDSWNYDAINAALEMRVLPEDSNFMSFEKCKGKSFNSVRDMVLDEVLTDFRSKVARLTAEGIDFEELQRVVLLRQVDNKWMEHMDNMTFLKQGIGLLAYGNRDPIVAYRNEGTDMFNEMTANIATDTATILCKSDIANNVQHRENKETHTNDKTTTQTRESEKIGRNDLCPCGSGKKYKSCCMNKA